MDLTAPDLQEQLPEITDGSEIGLLIYNADAIHGAEPFRLGAAILRGEDRRQSVTIMSGGSAGLYGLPMPDLPAAT